MALAIGLVAAGLILAGGARAITAGWTVQSSPDPGRSSALGGVAATSSTNAWAVGSYGTRAGVGRTLIERWHGKAWKVQPSPHPGSSSGLGGVAATSSTDAWAVGSQSKGGTYQTLVEHWDGSSWSVVPSPNPAGSSAAYLRAVAATSSTDAWAVGWYSNGTADQTLAEHWDGTAWTVVPSPNPGGSSGTFLTGVAAISSTDAWAVGYYGNRALIEHWDGTAWTVVPSPNTGGSVTALLAVAAISATDAWAVGYYHPVIFAQPLIEQWDGTAWTVVDPAANLADDLNPTVELDAVAANSSTDAWAVGYDSVHPRKKCPVHRTPLSCGFARTLVEHWNGTGWAAEGSPNPSRNDDFLNGVAATSTDAWAVGEYKNGKTVQTLIEHTHG